MKVRFLGTGASGGTPGEGRSARRESSAVVTAGSRTLIDVTRDFPEQCDAIETLDAVLITHAHRDACGGIAALRSWWWERASDPLPVYASARTIAVLRVHCRRLDHCAFVPVPGGRLRGTADVLTLCCFDTRLDRAPVLTGAAARGIAKRLRRRVYELIADPESFLVEDSEGPLPEGERARAWGTSLVEVVGNRA